MESREGMDPVVGDLTKDPGDDGTSKAAVLRSSPMRLQLAMQPAQGRP